MVSVCLGKCVKDILDAGIHRTESVTPSGMVLRLMVSGWGCTALCELWSVGGRPVIFIFLNFFLVMNVWSRSLYTSDWRSNSGPYFRIMSPDTEVLNTVSPAVRFSTKFSSFKWTPTQVLFPKKSKTFIIQIFMCI